MRAKGACGLWNVSMEVFGMLRRLIQTRVAGHDSREAKAQAGKKASQAFPAREEK